MRLYIAGPMTGIPELNKGSFEVAKRLLMAVGHRATTPFDVAARRGISQDEDSIAELLGADFKEIQESDGVVLLPGWDESLGTFAEIAFALRQSKVIFAILEDGGLHRVHTLGARLSFDDYETTPEDVIR